MLDRLAYVGSAIRSIASNPSMIQQPASNNSRNMRQVSLSNNSIRSRLAFDQEIRHAKAAFAEFIDLRYHDDDERKLTISLLGIDLALMSVLGSQTRLSSLAVGLTVLMTLGSSADRVINGNDNHTDIELRMKGMSRAIKVYLKSIVITTLLHYVSTAVYNTQNMDKAA